MANQCEGSNSGHLPTGVMFEPLMEKEWLSDSTLEFAPRAFTGGREHRASITVASPASSTNLSGPGLFFVDAEPPENQTTVSVLLDFTRVAKCGRK